MKMKWRRTYLLNICTRSFYDPFTLMESVHYLFPGVNPIMYQNLLVDHSLNDKSRMTADRAFLEVQGTAKTRSMTRNQNRDASINKRFQASDDSGSTSWSNLEHNLLLSVMMQLGVVDYYAFRGVCKSWRSLALTNMNRFMGSRQPMPISFSTGPKKECYLEDLEGRRFKTIIPHSNGSTCVGLASGYMILFGRKTRDFWLVNPFTRRDLYFPGFPFYVSTDPTSIRAILVFSPSVSGWVFVISHRFSSVISFSLAGTRASWNYLSTNFPFRDIHFFKGKIYTINKGGRLYEMRLNPQPMLTLVGMKNFPQPDFIHPEFVSLDKNLYVMDFISKDVYVAHKVDFNQMEWVSTENTIREYALFVSDLKSSAAINPDTWPDSRTQYKMYDNFLATDRSKNKGRCFTANMWYFPNEYLNVNHLE